MRISHIPIVAFFALLASCAPQSVLQAPHDKLQAALRRLPGPEYGSREGILKHEKEVEDYPSPKWVVENSELPDGTPLFLVRNKDNDGATGNQSCNAYVNIDGNWKFLREIDGTSGADFALDSEDNLYLTGYWHMSCATGGFWISKLNPAGKWDLHAMSVYFNEGQSLGEIIMSHASDDLKTLAWACHQETIDRCNKQEYMSSNGLPNDDLWLWMDRTENSEVRLMHLYPITPSIMEKQKNYQLWMIEDIRFDGVRYQTKEFKSFCATSPTDDPAPDQKLPGDWALSLLQDPATRQKAADWVFRELNSDDGLPYFYDESSLWRDALDPEVKEKLRLDKVLKPIPNPLTQP